MSIDPQKKVRIQKDNKRLWAFGWLELLLVLSLVALVMQLFPPVWSAVIWAIDIRNWPRTRLFAVNAAVVLALILIRFGPDLYEDWREQQIRRREGRRMKQKKEELKEQQRSMERQKEARKRRMY